MVSKCDTGQGANANTNTREEKNQPLEVVLLAVLHRVHLLLGELDFHLVAAHLVRLSGLS